MEWVNHAPIVESSITQWSFADGDWLWTVTIRLRRNWKWEVTLARINWRTGRDETTITKAAQGDEDARLIADDFRARADELLMELAL